MVWHEVPLTGNLGAPVRAADHRSGAVPRENWKAGVSPKTGNPVYERPVVLVIYREDHKFLLDPIIPRPGGTVANYDLVIASQPYRARASLEFKAKRVIAPLARALGPGGRLIAIHSARQRSRHGDHPEGLAGRQSVHPRPPSDPEGGQARARPGRARPQLQRLRRQPLAVPLRHAHAADRDLRDSSIGTSTLFAAWNAAIYVAQVEDDRLAEVVADGRYLEATREVLRKHGGLWFYDESYVISRRRE